jgi:hypothetical protein
MFGLTLFTRQEEMFRDWLTAVIDKKELTCVMFMQIQRNSRVYAWSANVTEFISEWMRCSSRPCIFELIKEDAPCRLYFDIESNHTSIPELTWCCDLIATINKSLLGQGIDIKYLTPKVTHAGRWVTSTNYKVSYHIIYSNIICLNNQVIMKRLVSIVQRDLNTSIYMSAIDHKVYTRNRLMRITLSPKQWGAVDCILTPWDHHTGTAVTFNDHEHMRVWVEETILTAHTISTDDKFMVGHMFFSSDLIPQVRAKRPSAHRRQVNTPNNPTRLVYILLPFLSYERAIGCNGFLDWMTIGWIVRDAFRDDREEGMYLFHLFSQRSPTYDESSVTAHFLQGCESERTGTNSVGIGTLIHNVRTDSPECANLIAKYTSHTTHGKHKTFEAWMRKVLFIIVCGVLKTDTQIPTECSIYAHSAFNQADAKLFSSIHSMIGETQNTHHKTIYQAWCYIMHTAIHKNKHLTIQLLSVAISI